MVLRGHVEGQTLVLEEPSGLPNGTRVEISVLESTEPEPVTDPSQTLYEKFRGIVGSVDDLPSDLAENHDHYLHGTPKVRIGRETTPEDAVTPSEENVAGTARRPTLLERLRPFVGAVQGLPEDLAENHDYYLHGAPKK